MAAVRENLERIYGLMNEAAKKSGRSAKDITLVAVTKGVNLERILEAYEAGIRLFGENRVQEALVKIPQLTLDAEWHMIGHLQSNKIKDALSLFTMIESVDSVRLAQKISGESMALGKVTPALLEINISGEAQKYGFGPEEIYSAIEEMVSMPGIRIEGLMGIAPNNVGDESKREAFRKLRNIFSVLKGLKKQNVEMKYLSMGMSDDFKIAVEEGSNRVRLGRALFQ